MPTPAKQNIRQQVYDRLRDSMQSGEIGYDDRLVDYEIATAFGVSRMPVREALLQLKSEGFLEGTARGFILRRFTPKDIAHIFEVRLLLEPPAAAAACAASSIEGLGEMTKAAADAERAHAKGDAVAYMRANWAFRGAWLAMVPNRHLVQTISRLHDHAEAVRIATLRDKTARALSLQHTRAILDAFVRHDAEAVKERVSHNLRASAATYYARQGVLIGDQPAAA
jgi:DNA-binding GntR family transcriptional regulator